MMSPTATLALALLLLPRLFRLRSEPFRSKFTPSPGPPPSASPSGSTPSGAACQPNARTLSELRRLRFAYFAKGECQDVAHKDGMF